MASRLTDELRQNIAGIVDDIRGQEFVTVADDIDLAAALCGIGVRQLPLAMGNSVVSVRRIGGRTQTVFYFATRSSDGSYLTKALIQAWKRDMEFIRDNPSHPFSFVMIGLKNRKTILKRMEDSSRTIIGLARPQADPTTRSVLYVVDGSRKHKVGLSKGLVEI